MKKQIIAILPLLSAFTYYWQNPKARFGLGASLAFPDQGLVDTNIRNTFLSLAAGNNFRSPAD